jgi:hypothetical protein
MAADVKYCESRLGLRNSAVRIPFRYGSACLTRCPQAMLELIVEVDGKQQAGYAADCLPPSWFDKSPDKSYSRQIEEMIGAIELAQRCFEDEMPSASSCFDAWLTVLGRVHAEGAHRGWSALLSSFGVSMVERALLDATARRHGQSFSRALRGGLYGIRPGEVHLELAGANVSEWLPLRQPKSLHVRHTIGLGDPLTSDEIAREDRQNDGRPQSLDEYIEQCGISYFKIKVSNQLDLDLERLRCIAGVIEARLAGQYRVTLDGNEQYGDAAQFDELVDAVRAEPDLETLWRNVLVIEQPLARSIALEHGHTDGIRELSRSKPVIIDESDGELDSFVQAMELGYRGVSSKNCKGPIKSILNAGLVWNRNQRGGTGDYVMTAEDLCTVGVVSVQSDLCLVAALGLEHVEKNGHHFMPGLDYLPLKDQQAALASHDDFYQQQGDSIGPRIEQGKFQVESLGCAGFGFDVVPNMDKWTSAGEWEFSSLGLEE